MNEFDHPTTINVCFLSNLPNYEKMATFPPESTSAE
jgi:hypothetical protein